MATVNYCADGRTYLEITPEDRARARYTATGQMFLELDNGEAESLRDEAAHSVEAREETER